jgi:hypothetical protein
MELIEVVVKDKIMINKIIENSGDTILVEDLNGKTRLISKDKIAQINRIIEKRIPIKI